MFLQGRKEIELHIQIGVASRNGASGWLTEAWDSHHVRVSILSDAASLMMLKLSKYWALWQQVTMYLQNSKPNL